MAIKNHSIIILSSTLEHKYIRVFSLTPRCSSVLKSFAPSPELYANMRCQFATFSMMSSFTIS